MLKNLEWMDQPFAKEIMSYDSHYELDIYLKGKWLHVRYTGFNWSGLYFEDDKGNEIEVSGLEVIIAGDNLKCKIPEGLQKYSFER